jgi:Fructose-2,6-bisphosphatase
MVVIYLIRHGETDFNKNGFCQGRSDVPLNENGKISAKKLADIFLLNHISINAIYSSPLLRAKETAMIISKYSNKNENILVDHAFIERDFGELECKEVNYVRKIVTNPTQVKEVKNYENDETVANRFYDGLYKIAKNSFNQTILVVSHSHAIKCLLMKIDPSKYSISTKTKNMNTTKIIFNDNKFIVDKFDCFNIN